MFISSFDMEIHRAIRQGIESNNFIENVVKKITNSDIFLFV